MNKFLNCTALVLLIAGSSQLHGSQASKLIPPAYLSAHDRRTWFMLLPEFKHNDSLVQSLIAACNLDFNAYDKLGWAARVRAYYGSWDNPKITQFLNTGADKLWTVFLIAIALNDADGVRLFASAGAQLNMQTDSGKTALMYACSYGYAKIVRLLVELGADATIKNEQDNNKIALDYAEQTDKSAIEIAIEAGTKDRAQRLECKEKIKEKATQ